MAEIDAFFDTSVLVAAADEAHVHYERSRPLLLAATPKHGCCAAHNLTEFYSTVTRIPGPGRLSSHSALEHIRAIRGRLSLIALSASEHEKALAHWALRDTAGGAIYDAMIASCALKAGAKVLYTWNVKDFARLGPEVAAITRTP